jgi:two-component system OmpR family response regulator
MKILIVEDDLRIQSVVQRALQENGYAVDAVSDGQEALTSFSINVYDLVLLDLLLPGIRGGGIEVCRQIRLMDRGVPILMLTALD